MKLKISPIDQALKRAERRINFYRAVSLQDLAHDRKRQLAQAVAAGAVPTPEFEAAAALEGLSPADLAKLILTKADVMMAAENARRSLIVQVRKATTPEEIDAILVAAKVPEYYADKRMELAK